MSGKGPQLLDAALGYRDRGLSVVPLVGKRPLVTWQPYQQRCPSRDEILGWWTDVATANVGIVTGAVSAVVALDVDDALGAATLARLESVHARLPETLIQRTPHGRHLLFCHPG